MDEPISSPSLNEMKQVVAKCTCFSLRKATRTVTQLFDEALKPSGLLATQFTILTAICVTGAVTINELAKILVMDRTTLTRNLKPLERDGLIAIAPGRDKRTRVLSLTPKGQSALALALPLWKQVQEDLIKRLGENKWNALLANLSDTTTLTHKK